MLLIEKVDASWLPNIQMLLMLKHNAFFRSRFSFKDFISNGMKKSQCIKFTEILYQIRQKGNMGLKLSKKPESSSIVYPVKHQKILQCWVNKTILVREEGH